MAATIETILQLKAELDALRPLKKEDEERLWKKFRLEWNYNSNHIEGNTLSYGETELLLIFGKTTGDHTLREYEEMKAHDTAVFWLKDEAAQAEDRMSETFIRQLNEIILKEPYWKVVETPEGKQTRKEIIPGQYKTSPNSVLLASGEMFHYASPEETPSKMGDLMQWYRGETENGSKHPVQIAAELHYKFVLIHPFDDGNGRVARLLMNYVLMRASYPPVIILSKDKKGYLDALNKMDTGVDHHALRNYIAYRLVWSLETSIKAAKGEDIEEEDDWEKDFFLWKRKSVAQEPLLSTLSKDNYLTAYEAYKTFLTILTELLEKHLGDLFARVEYDTSSPIKVPNDPIAELDNVIALKKMGDIVRSKVNPSFWKPIEQLDITIQYNSCKLPKAQGRDYTANISLTYFATHYLIKVNNADIIEGYYNRELSREKVISLSRETAKSTIATVRDWSLDT